MHKVTFLVACLTSKGLGRGVLTSTHQLPQSADAHSSSTSPAAAETSTLDPRKAALMLAFALNPRSAFATPAQHVQIDSPTFADRGLEASNLQSRVLRGARRSGAAPLAIIGDLLKEEQKLAKKQIDKINVPKKKQDLIINKWLKLRELQIPEFIGGYKVPRDMPYYKMPEVTFGGRSNVGKSTALNTLVGGTSSKLAVTSKTPGRTRLINLFKIGKVCSITDLPGYGYAAVSDDMQQKWQSGITGYLRHREHLRVCVIFVDAQRDPQEADGQLLDFLEAEKVPCIVVATKIDKVKKEERKKKLHLLYESLALPEGQPIPFSGKTGEGKKEVWKALAEKCLEQRRARKEEEEPEEEAWGAL